MSNFKRFFNILLVFMLVFSIAIPVLADGNDKKEKKRQEITMEFKDSDDAKWANEYISKMKSKKVLEGYNGYFNPNKPINRAEAIITVVRLMGLEDEAKQIPSDTNLNFKDAKQIQKKFPWAVGYIVVALENGLFDSSLEMIQPDKGATRAWVATLLVKGLGLEQEALAQMNAELDFTDTSEIPAGSIGYVKVAADHDLITGYPDGSFKPNKTVTRAEMAALLDRMNDNMLEEDGAVIVMGAITAISFNNNTNEEASTNGAVTVETFNGDSATYLLSSELLVQSQSSFIKAEDLVIGDTISFVVKDGIVLEGTLIDEEAINENTAGIREFKLEAKGNTYKYEIKYKNDDGKIKAEIKKEEQETEVKIGGQEAISQMEALLNQLQLTPEMNKDEVLTKVTEALEINLIELEKLEVKVTFANGTVIKIENDDENEDAEQAEESPTGIKEMKIKAEGGSFKLELKYEYEDGEAKAEIKKEIQDSEVTIKGEEAVIQMEALMNQLQLTSDLDESQILEQVIQVLEINQEDIDKLEIEIKFANGEETKIENEDDESGDKG